MSPEEHYNLACAINWGFAKVASLDPESQLAGDLGFDKKLEGAYQNINPQNVTPGANTFFDMKGNKLGEIPTTDGSTTISFCPNMTPAQFQEIYEQVSARGIHGNGQEMSAAMMSGIPAIRYDLDEYLNWNLQNDDDIYKGTAFQQNDNKGPLKVEHASELNADSEGFMRVMPGFIRGEPNNVPGLDNRKYYIHNHVNEGRKYLDNNKTPLVLLPGVAGMVSDRSANNTRTFGAFEVTVINNRVYLYNKADVFFVYEKK